MSGAPDFSSVARSYSESRPGYPAALFDWLASIVPDHDVAWDAATGSGQAAIGLARHFRHVIGTDTSEQQILHARSHPRVEYRVGPAEVSGLPDRSVDLVVAASALHWFDLGRFSAEVERVARRGGVVAAWTYHVGHVEPPFDAVLWPLYRDVVGPYFAAGARLVDDRYRGISLPGEEIVAPAFFVSVQWTPAQMLAFIRTWSGVQSYMRATGSDPVTPLTARMEELWGGADSLREVRWPLYLRVARLGG
jgi:ubiquinone/menaquinone biosynthesis C-methylase UbiE